jgi:hypothetical protein
MRWTSTVVNPRVAVFFSRIDNLMFTSYEGNNSIIIRKYSKMLIAWMFCFAEDRKIISSGIENTVKEMNWKYSEFSTHFRLSGFVDRATTRCLPLHYICLECTSGGIPLQQICHKTPKLYYYLYIITTYVRYNNT